jgi:putative endonuclease
MSEYYVYIMASRSKALYTGVTNDLVRRVYEHKTKALGGHTAKYNENKLVYFDSTDDIAVAIGREKQIKGWNRAKKILLIESVNPGWEDLSTGWMDLETPVAGGNSLGRERRTFLSLSFRARLQPPCHIYEGCVRRISCHRELVRPL